VLLLRNHGPVTIGATVAQALVLMWTVTRACEVQLATQSMGEAIPIPPAVLEKCVADSFQFSAKYSAGEDAFAALRRLVDRKDPSYRL
jgi:ribulose-5-phosphate 4-epimerase/fuculose-1-phosphate aldolase